MVIRRLRRREPLSSLLQVVARAAESRDPPLHLQLEQGGHGLAHRQGRQAGYGIDMLVVAVQQCLGHLTGIGRKAGKGGRIRPCRIRR